MAEQCVSVVYDLDPPSGVVAPGPAKATLSHPLRELTTKSSSDFYAAAGPALAALRDELNAVLTDWKEAVGDLEKPRESQGVVEAGKGKSHIMSQEASDEESDE
jgi:hypothetical protein